VAVVAMVACGGGRAWADEKTDVGNGAKAWATALMDGDAKAIKAHSLGDEADVARWEGMAKMMAGFKKMADAATAKYGDDAAMMSRMFKKPDFSQLQNESKIEVSGDDASITGKDSKVMKLKKDGGEWKVVLSSMRDGARMEPKQANAMAEAASSMGDEIKDGKYATFVDAMKAFQQKMVAAMGAPPGGRPGAGAPPRQ
jgi:hypothetical protein